MIRDKISKETEDSVIKEFINFLKSKIDKKGRGTFVSREEVTGKILEETNEVFEEAHKKDSKKMELELMDVATIAIFGIMSLRTIAENKK